MERSWPCGRPAHTCRDLWRRSLLLERRQAAQQHGGHSDVIVLCSCRSRAPSRRLAQQVPSLGSLEKPAPGRGRRGADSGHGGSIARPAL